MNGTDRKSSCPIAALAKVLTEFARSSRSVFLLALFSGIIISIVSVVFIYDIYRDVANVYAYHAREIASGNWRDGWVGHVPMLHILLSGILARLTGLEAFRATCAVSSAFFVLTLFPLRRLLERYATPVWSAWGCVLFVFTPKVIRFSVSGMLDSGRLFFLIAALLYFFRASDENSRYRQFVLLGLSLAGLSVSRGEGILIAVGMLLAFPIFFFLKRKKISGRIWATYGLAVLFFVAGISPFCGMNWRRSHVFISDLRISDDISRVLFRSETKTESAAVAEEAIFKVREKNLFSRISGVCESALRGGYEVYCIFALLGMVILLFRRKWNWEFTALIGVFAAHSIIYALSVAAYRYSIYLVPLFMPFTVTGLGFVGEEGKKLLVGKFPAALPVMPPALGILAVLVLVLQAVNGLSCVIERKDRGSREAAKFIREYAAAHFPGRRCRIAASRNCPETVYWSGAVSVWGYKQCDLPAEQQNTKDFDLFLLNKKYPCPSQKATGKLVEIPVPDSFPVRIFRKAESVE